MNQFPLQPLFSTSLYQFTGKGVRKPKFSDSLLMHTQAALDWIERAAQVSEDGGISKGFDLIRGRWAPAYPETTGYTIPTLLNASETFQSPKWKNLALQLADYELKNSTAEGGVVHWQAKNNAQPIVFDTGQVIFGWLAAYRSKRDLRYLEAAQRAGHWLASIQDTSGKWESHQHLGITKVIDTRVAWALLALNQITFDETYLKAARNNLFWAIHQQDDHGWFHQCAFRPEEDPFTHTLAYTAEGLLEGGILLDEAILIEHAKKTADAMMHLQNIDGSLSGTFGPKWTRPARWSCLTGNCQMARLWLRLYQVTHQPDYLLAAEKAIQFVASIQDLDTSNQNLRGGIPGSQPLWGAYERFKMPNWAAKFFIDAILQVNEINSGEKRIHHPG